MLKQVNFQLLFTSLVLEGLRLLLPVIAFRILNLIYHNKKDIARVFCLPYLLKGIPFLPGGFSAVVAEPSVMAVAAELFIFPYIICPYDKNDNDERTDYPEGNENEYPPSEGASLFFDFGIA